MNIHSKTNSIDTNTEKKSVVILGATSAIARSTAECFARAGYSILLGASDQVENERIAADIHLRFEVSCSALYFDALELESHIRFLEKCKEELGDEPTGVVLCFGNMPEQELMQRDNKVLSQSITINLTGAISILEVFAALFEARGHGFITGVSSVAGERGKQSNYIYGASKAGFTVFLEGLRVRMSKAGVSVTTIIPGFVDTKMTYGLNLPAHLMASPAQAGLMIYRATLKQKNKVYIPHCWYYIMLIIKLIPDSIFKKMSM